jgi:hypothetical protein
LRPYNAGEAATLLATLRLRQSRFDEAASALEVAFHEFTVDPWALLRFKEQAMELANELGSHSPVLARRMFDALDHPFALEAMRDQRFLTRSRLAQLADFRHLCRDAIAPLEAHVLWTDGFLTMRRACYEAIGDSRLGVAKRRGVAGRATSVRTLSVRAHR